MQKKPIAKETIAQTFERIYSGNHELMTELKDKKANDPKEYETGV